MRGGAIGAQRGVQANKYQRKRALRGKRDVFLSHLAANCNVEGAAAAAGTPLNTLYRWRRTDADFAGYWAEAVAIGYEMLEMRLIAHALAGKDAAELDAVADMPVEPVNVELAIRLLSLQQRNKVGKGTPGAPRKIVTPEEVDARLIAKLDALAERKMGAERKMVAARKAEAQALLAPSDAAVRVIEHHGKVEAA